MYGCTGKSKSECKLSDDCLWIQSKKGKGYCRRRSPVRKLNKLPKLTGLPKSPSRRRPSVSKTSPKRRPSVSKTSPKRRVNGPRPPFRRRSSVSKTSPKRRVNGPRPPFRRRSSVSKTSPKRRVNGPRPPSRRRPSVSKTSPNPTHKKETKHREDDSGTCVTSEWDIEYKKTYDEYVKEYNDLMKQFQDPKYKRFIGVYDMERKKELETSLEYFKFPKTYGSRNIVDEHLIDTNVGDIVFSYLNDEVIQKLYLQYRKYYQIVVIIHQLNGGKVEGQKLEKNQCISGDYVYVDYPQHYPSNFLYSQKDEFGYKKWLSINRVDDSFKNHFKSNRRYEKWLSTISYFEYSDILYRVTTYQDFILKIQDLYTIFVLGFLDRHQEIDLDETEIKLLFKSPIDKNVIFCIEPRYNNSYYPYVDTYDVKTMTGFSDMFDLDYPNIGQLPNLIDELSTFNNMSYQEIFRNRLIDIVDIDGNQLGVGLMNKFEKFLNHSDFESILNNRELSPDSDLNDFNLKLIPLLSMIQYADNTYREIMKMLRVEITTDRLMSFKEFVDTFRPCNQKPFISKEHIYDRLKNSPYYRPYHSGYGL